jgi:transcriptional regulator NrdR family protein
MIVCPFCGSENRTRYRSPRAIEDVLVRRHVCSNCNRIYATAEVVLGSRASEHLIDLVETAWRGKDA